MMLLADSKAARMCLERELGMVSQACSERVARGPAHRCSAFVDHFSKPAEGAAGAFHDVANTSTAPTFPQQHHTKMRCWQPKVTARMRGPSLSDAGPWLSVGVGATAAFPAFRRGRAARKRLFGCRREKVTAHGWPPGPGLWARSARAWARARIDGGPGAPERGKPRRNDANL